MNSTTQMVQRLKAEQQDFEWYPTTDTMLQVIRADIVKQHGDREGQANVSVLDCGAGDGRALEALAGEYGDKYSIEQSALLVGQQGNDVVPVGTDFHAATLIDKSVQVVFSNPPYSEFETWAVKIIREAHAVDVYLVIPQRWQDSEAIADALASREAEASIIHADDFFDAERQARARVHIVRVNLAVRNRQYTYRDSVTPDTDPFELWFEQTFPKAETQQTDTTEKEKQDRLQKQVKREMVSGKNLIEALVVLYQSDMTRLQKNYAAACSLDADLLEELNIEYTGLKKAIRQRIKGLKHLYWHEFFANYESITDRLTSGSRQQLLRVLHKNTAVEFSAENAYAITLWVIRNANHYYDDQLIALVERMTRKANVALYTSNQRTFQDEDWRYNWREQAPEGLDHYKLEYRIVLHHIGGIFCGDFGRWENPGGLEKRAHDFLGDVLAVAKTLGWNTHDSTTHVQGGERLWESNRKQYFTCENGKVLMEVKAFKNGNLHIKFNQAFMQQLNVEFGRLQGWLKDKQQAADELKIKPEAAAGFFCSTLKIGAAASLRLLESPRADVAEDNTEMPEQSANDAQFALSL